MNAKPQVALDGAAVGRSIRRIAHEIAERNGGADNLALIGVIRRGARLAERLAAELHSNGARSIPVGTLDISSYRDDGKGHPGDPRLLARDIPFSLDRKRVVLVDDVLYTGRTVRAALDRSRTWSRGVIQLAVLIDRGERGLPIQRTTWARTSRRPPWQSMCDSRGSRQDRCGHNQERKVIDRATI